MSLSIDHIPSPHPSTPLSARAGGRHTQGHLLVIFRSSLYAIDVRLEQVDLKVSFGGWVPGPFVFFFFEGKKHPKNPKKNISPSNLAAATSTVTGRSTPRLIRMRHAVPFLVVSWLTKQSSTRALFLTWGTFCEPSTYPGFFASLGSGWTSGDEIFGLWSGKMISSVFC